MTTPLEKQMKAKAEKQREQSGRPPAQAELAAPPQPAVPQPPQPPAQAQEQPAAQEAAPSTKFSAPTAFGGPREEEPPQELVVAGEQPAEQAVEQPMEAQSTGHTPPDTTRAAVEAPAVQLLISQIAQTQKMEWQQFQMLIVPEAGEPRVETYERMEDLIAAIKQLLGVEVYLFPFLGAYMPISDGPLRYMITPFGQQPLFDLPTAAELAQQTSGYVGRLQEQMEMPQVTEPEEEDDEPEEGDDDVSVV